jgi:hypothetical protein
VSAATRPPALFVVGLANGTLLFELFWSGVAVVTV